MVGKMSHFHLHHGWENEGVTVIQNFSMLQNFLLVGKVLNKNTKSKAYISNIGVFKGKIKI